MLHHLRTQPDRHQRAGANDRRAAFSEPVSEMPGRTKRMILGAEAKGILAQVSQGVESDQLRATIRQIGRLVDGLRERRPDENPATPTDLALIDRLKEAQTALRDALPQFGATTGALASFTIGYAGAPVGAAAASFRAGKVPAGSGAPHDLAAIARSAAFGSAAGYP